jgi:ABC-2 type transport system ATP-binding protein
MKIIHSGATTILVSHSLLQIRRMSINVLWLDKEKQINFGNTKTVCDKYEKFLERK